MMLTDVSNDLRRPVEAEESTPSWRCRTGVDVEDGPMNMYVLNFHGNLSASYSSLCHSVAPDPPFGPQRVCGLHNGPAAILWRTPAPNKSCCSLPLKLICRPTRHVRRAAHEHPLILLHVHVVWSERRPTPRLHLTFSLASCVGISKTQTCPVINIYHNV